MDHFHYCADLVGLDHVGFGPDTLYGDHVGLHRTFAGLLGHPASAGPEHPVVEYVDGLENPSESFHNIAAWLVRDGLSDERSSRCSAETSSARSPHLARASGLPRFEPVPRVRPHIHIGA